MSTPRRPSPAVARRRRFVALLLGIFLLALIIWGVRGIIGAFTSDEDQSAQEPTSAQTPAEQEENATQGGDQQAADAEQPGEQTEGTSEDAPETEAPESDGSESPEPEVPEGHCAPADIEVTASTNEDSYGAAEAPLLIMEIGNTGDQECTLDVGTGAQQWSIAHGDQEIFTTDQCEIDGESLEIEFAPGDSERAQLTWPRSESAVDCSSPAQLAGGEYQLTVGVSGISSAPYTFDLAGTDQQEPEQ